MSHDRGCPCGRESWEYRACPRRSIKMCYKESVVAMWDNQKAKDEKPLPELPYVPS